MTRESSELDRRCELLRSLHTPGDAAGAPERLGRGIGAGRRRGQASPSSRPPAAASPPRSATRTTSTRPAAEMLAAAGRIGRSVDVPMTVDAEAGYGMKPEDLVAALAEHGRRRLQPRGHEPRRRRVARPGVEHADVAPSPSARPRPTADYPLVINARIDVFLVRFARGLRRLLKRELLARRADARARVPGCRRRLCVPDRAVGSGRAAASSSPAPPDRSTSSRSPQAPSLPELAEARRGTDHLRQPPAPRRDGAVRRRSPLHCGRSKVRDCSD